MEVKCLLYVRKAFDTVWIHGLPCKLLSESGIRGRMWLAIKSLYTGVKAQVIYSGSLFRKFDVSQRTVDESVVYEYKNLGVVKNYIGSCILFCPRR